MNVGFFNRVPLQPLVLLWLSYTWLEWYLSAYKNRWFVGALIAALVLAVVWKGIYWLKNLVKFCSKILVVVLVLSTSIVLVATWPLLLTFVVLPWTTTVLADIELRFAGFSKQDMLLVLTVVSGFGLAVGKIIDLVLLPSSRY